MFARFLLYFSTFQSTFLFYFSIYQMEGRQNPRLILILSLSVPREPLTPKRF